MRPSGRESRNAYRDILRALRRAVANPLAFARDDGLARAHLENPRFVLDPHHAVQQHCEFIEVRALPWFTPTGWAPHMRDAHRGILRVYVANVLVNPLVAWNGNRRGFLNESGHALMLPESCPSGRPQRPRRARVLPPDSSPRYTLTI